MECCSCEEIREIVIEVLTEYLSQLRTKAKRKPSAYNVFMGECVRSKPKDMPIQERFKQCALEYRKSKKKHAGSDSNSSASASGSIF